MPFSPRVCAFFRPLVSKVYSRDPEPVRILIVGMNYAPEFIGVGKYTTQLAEYLARSRCEVEVVTALPHYPDWKVVGTPLRYRTSHENGVRITRCPLLIWRACRGWRLLAPLSFSIMAAPAIVWRAIRARPRTVLCVEPTLFAAPASLLAAALLGSRAVLHVQDLEVDAAFAAGHLSRKIGATSVHAVERFLLRGFDEIVTISDAMAARLRNKGVAPNKIRIVRNWISGGSGAPAPMPTPRDALGIPRETTLILYAGNLGVKQGLPVLIEAARRLRADRRFHFLVVGAGPLRPMLRAAAVALPNLTVTGLLPADALASLLVETDMHVLPQDPAATDLVFPSKLGPILASGKPLVVTARPDSELARWLGPAAVCTPPGDGRALAEALEAMPRRDDPDRIRVAKALAMTLDAEAVLPAFRQCIMGAVAAELQDRKTTQEALAPAVSL